ncbi:response regulator containing a CheY-like receiver domain and an HTH DNA-binding domain [Sphaerochaeta pleomorpha str. Grapes]|uniref:Response regulator containing a CheY-like receiver domain and an HTH DNA-binding domain n=1 Tax=Sphaerochaeta pleomorpha (strain ATCC BAA-1885 / DSM 22778 / Grapes) TaxID=158190 RepID=G8QXV6_SPHPG|nr:LuxR C-terminal-related transcriptional regulator [Sphaerochaeta pleomorpha]AEV30750.1 response regulator containing a CheY-like receiver domain and an HTH DNA-binding domain [Sphaerochaeta pleomorpha str. Grapes]
MNGVTLLVYMLAFAIGCMTLALAVVYCIQSPHTWTKYFIICHASLLGCMMFLALQLISSLFLSGQTSVVIGYVIEGIIIADITFLTVFIPYFTTWVIAQPWRNPYRLLFFCLGGIYLACGVLNVIFEIKILSDITILLFVFVVGFCLIVMLKNINSIEDKRARATCFATIIVSATMLPAIMLALFFPAIKPLMYGIYFLAFSITIMTFLFMEFTGRSREMLQAKKELTLADLEPYHITEREFGVIQLISKGLTNKEIASELNISANTVNNHVANIFSKAKVRSRIDLLNLLKQPW